MTSINTYGEFTGIPYLTSELAKFHLPIDELVETMDNTSIVIGGGFVVNQLLDMSGNPISNKTGDIDFFVYGGIKPLRRNCIDHYDYYAQCHKEGAFRTMVLAQFNSLVNRRGYVRIEDGSEYEQEATESGDRIFTTGSNVRMHVYTFGRYMDGVLTHKLNLAFSDTPISTLMLKVDIRLTAGFLYSRGTNPENLMYEHYFPEDVNELALRWVEEDSTHTPRQLARWQKYKERYNILERRTLTANEFIAEFDELPDEIHITLIGTSDQLHSRPVMRRMTALPRSVFELRISAISPIVIPPIVDPWNELPRDPGSPHNRILEHTDTDDTNESDDDTVLSPSVDADNLTAISQVSLHYYYQELNI